MNERKASGDARDGKPRVRLQGIRNTWLTLANKEMK